MVELDLKRLPKHVAVIMDGNGRWASQRSKNRIYGHKKGAERARAVVSCCRRLGIRWLTLFAFSKENWNRPAYEVRALWGLLDRFLRSELPLFIENEVQLRHIGDVDGIPAPFLKRLRMVQETTSRFDKLVLNVAINYGGRHEIVRAAKLFLADVMNGRHGVGQLSPELFSSYFYTGDCPDPDLVIRTGGELRVSNFLLWQIAYAELYFTEVLWPDFGEADLIDALMEFQSRERRFGRTGQQVKSRGHEDLQLGAVIK